MKFILGIKKEMSQIFREGGEAVPVTIISVPENYIISTKGEKEKDGYDAVQIGISNSGFRKTNQAEKGHLKKSGHEKTNKLK